jgi:exosortase family protein XrtM
MKQVVTGFFSRLRACQPEWIFALLFLATFGALSALYGAARGTATERLLIDQLTVRPSAAAIALLTPGEKVVARGSQLVSPFARLSILNGCEGIETMLLLIAAIIAYAAPWREKLLAALLGVLLVYALNQIRIVSLFYAFHYDRQLFHLLHGVVAPLFLVACAGLFFLWWLSRLRSNAALRTP